MAVTRAELRRRIGRMMGTLLEVEATSAGSTTTFVDAIRLGLHIESPKNRDIIFTNGTNAGQVRRVTAVDLTTGTLTFAALPVATVAGDTAELYNLRAKSVTVADIHDAINQAVDSTWPLYKEPYTVDVTDPFDSDDPVVTIPSGLTHIDRVQYQTDDGDWITVPSPAWAHDRYLEEVTISGDSLLTTLDGQSLRLVGGMKPEPLDEDDDETNIKPGYIVHQAVAILCQGLYNRGESEYYNMALVNQQEALRLKPRSRGSGLAVRGL